MIRVVLLSVVLLSTALSPQFFIGGMALSHYSRSTSFRRGCMTLSSCLGRTTGNRLAKLRTRHPLMRPLVSKQLYSNSSGNYGPTSSQKSCIDLDANQQKELSNYERLVRKLYMTNLFNPVKLGLENMDRLHKVLGSPMDQVRLCFSVCTSYALGNAILT